MSKLKADDALKCIENYGEKDEIEIAMEIGPDLKELEKLKFFKTYLKQRAKDMRLERKRKYQILTFDPYELFQSYDIQDYLFSKAMVLPYFTIAILHGLLTCRRKFK